MATQDPPHRRSPSPPGDTDRDGDGGGEERPPIPVDIKGKTGLRNVVLHFRVPRDGVSRRVSRRGLSVRMRDRMRREESTRRWRRNEILESKRCRDDDDDCDVGGEDTAATARTDNGAYPGKVFRRGRGGGGRRRGGRRRGGGGGEAELRPGETYESLGEGRNFFVLAADGAEERFVYTVFPASGCVVATGLRHFPRFLPSPCAEKLCPLPDVLKTFCNLTGLLPENIWDVRVTNSTWSGNLRPADGDKETLGSVMEMLHRYSRLMSRGGKEEQNVSIDFRSQFFPGARLQRAELTGVINLFNNGSFVLVGVRNETQAEKLLDWLAAITNMFWKNPLGGKPYVWTVGSSWKLCLAWEAMKL